MPEHSLLVMGVATFFFSALAGITEEARLAIQLLPLYAALPVALTARRNSQPGRASPASILTELTDA